MTELFDEEYEKILKREAMKLFLRMKTMSEEPVITLNADNFQRVVENSEKIVVDFWAEWCAPCRIMHPIFEKLAKKYSGKIKFAKLNVDENQPIAAKYEVFSIPTFILFINGKPVDRLIGAVSESVFENFIRKYLD